MKSLAYLLIFCSSYGFAQLFQASTPITVAPALGNAHPQLEMTNDGQPAVIWSNIADNHIYFAKYNGSSFDPPITLNPPLMDMQVYNFAGPDLAMDGDNIYVVLRSLGYNTGHIYMVKSQDNGATFGDTIQVDNLSTGFGQYPDVAAMNDTVWVTFMDHDASGFNPEYVVTRSVDGGDTWEPAVPAGSLFTGEACDCCPPEIIVDESRVIVYFRNNNGNVRDIKAVVSYDRGVTFTDMFSVDDHNWIIAGCPSTGPDARFMDADKTISVYKTNISGANKIFMNEFNLQTMTSEGLVELTSSSGTNASNNYPQVDYKNGVTAVVWEGNENGVDIYFNAAVGGANEIQTADAINVTDSPGTQNKPDMIIGNGKYYIVYADSDGQNVKFVEVSVTAGMTEPHSSISTLVYPVPAKDQAVISFETHQLENLTFELFDLQGKLLRSETISGNQYTVDRDGLSPGQYIYTISSECCEGEGRVVFE